MTNDISTAKKFRDEYFTRLGHEMNSYTVISLMVEYAGSMHMSTGPVVDVEALERQVEILRTEQELMQTQVTSLEIALADKEQVILDLTQEILSLQEQAQEEPVLTSEEVDKPKTPRASNKTKQHDKNNQGSAQESRV